MKGTFTITTRREVKNEETGQVVDWLEKGNANIDGDDVPRWDYAAGLALDAYGQNLAAPAKGKK